MYLCFSFITVTVDDLYPLALLLLLSFIGTDPLSAVFCHHIHRCETLGSCVKPDDYKSKFVGTPTRVPNHYIDKAP